MPGFPGFTRIANKTVGPEEATSFALRKIAALRQRGNAGRIFFAAIASIVLLSGCAFTPLSRGYREPPERPDSFELYYSKGRSYSGAKITQTEARSGYTIRQYEISSDYGVSQIEFYDTGRKGDELVFVFPILGGKYWFERYFAEYLAERGIDAAIIMRDPEIKKVENIDRIEELFRQGVVRDRITMDYFENELGKKQFGSFGISRGGINVAMTAGVDPRLKFNIIVMGGTDLINLMKDSTQNGVNKFKRKVEAYKKMEGEQFYDFLRANVRTEPKNLASYIDARNTLMFVTAFDRTVPFKYQMRLRRQMGEPETIYLAADHYLSLLYTQFVPVLLPKRSLCLFPFDFIEAESLAFYRRNFGRSEVSWKRIPYAILTLPAKAFGYLRCMASRDCREGPKSGYQDPADGLMYVQARPEIPKGVMAVRLRDVVPATTREAKLGSNQSE